MIVPKNVIDKELYKKTREKVKNKVKVWPSAYASGQLVREYKKAGGRYFETKIKSYKKTSPLSRWYREIWVNVCEKENSLSPPYKKCGRKKVSNQKFSNYPYCRPYYKITKNTPMTVNEIINKYGEKKINEMCKKKRKEGLPEKKSPKRIYIKK